MSAKIVSCTVVLAVLGASAANALASPGAGSIASQDGSWIYMVSPQSGDPTIVTKIRGSDRTAQVKRRLNGSFEVPLVAGEKSGLSRDGSTLVLSRHIGRVTRFAVLDTGALRPRRMLTLRGTYDFDALAPDASRLYVIRYSAGDADRYAVQVLNLQRANATPRTVVEKGEPGEPMAGRPVARTESRNGDWVYTLYRRNGDAPFVHALSTTQTVTICIDLDDLQGRPDIAALKLRLRPGTHALDVTAAGKPVASVDTESFEVTTPAHDGETTAWWLLAGAVAVLGAAAIARRKSPQKNATPGQI